MFGCCLFWLLFFVVVVFLVCFVVCFCFVCFLLGFFVLFIIWGGGGCNCFVFVVLREGRLMCKLYQLTLKNQNIK